MTIQVQRFIVETQKWRTTRAVESFLDAQAQLEEMPWAIGVEPEQWETYEQIGMALAGLVSRFTDVVTVVNQTQQLIIRTERSALRAMERGYMFICIGPKSTTLDVQSFWEVKGAFVHGTVPLKSLKQAVGGVDFT